MMDQADFVGLLARARTGDEAAVHELLERYQDDLCMIVRGRLPRRLRAQFDSMDFVQAVWQSFFTPQSRQEPVSFRDSGHLWGYLAGMARNKVAEEYRRRTQTRKYDLSREEPLYVRRGDRELPRSVAATDPSPSQQAQVQDCLDQLVAGGNPVVAEVVALRGQGMTFEEVAERTGLSERAVRRVVETLRRRLEDRP